MLILALRFGGAVGQRGLLCWKLGGDGAHPHPTCFNSFFRKAHAMEPWGWGWVGGGQRAREQAQPGPASLPAGLRHL